MAARGETPGGPLIALVRAGASVTLEPGGQLELSGAPLDNVHLICTEGSGHLAELRDISEELGIMWLGVGFHPFARQADLSWVPKGRYKIMREYLPRQGAYGLDMMRRTCDRAGELRLLERGGRAPQAARLAPPLAGDHGHVRELAVLRGQALGRAQLPREGVARRRSRRGRGSCRACSERPPLRRLRRVGPRRADVRRQARQGGASRHDGHQSFRRFMEYGSPGTRATHERLGDAPQHASSPRCASSARSRCAARTRCRRASRARCPRCGPGSSTTSAPSPRPRSSPPRTRRPSSRRCVRRWPSAPSRRASAARRSPTSPSGSIDIGMGGLERRAPQPQRQGRARPPRAARGSS